MRRILQRAAIFLLRWFFQVSAEAKAHCLASSFSSTFVRLLLVATSGGAEHSHQVSFSFSRYGLSHSRFRIAIAGHGGRKSVARSLGMLGDALMHGGKLDESEKLNRQSLAMKRKLWGNEHSQVAAALNNLALLPPWLTR